MNIEICKKCRRCCFNFYIYDLMRKKPIYYFDCEFIKETTYRKHLKFRKHEKQKIEEYKIKNFYCNTLNGRYRLNDVVKEMKQEDEVLQKIFKFFKNKAKFSCPYEFEHKIMEGKMIK